jgi:hypothetical protein
VSPSEQSISVVVSPSEQSIILKVVTVAHFEMLYR